MYIRKMNSGDLALKDLEIFVALLRSHNVTETGRELRLSQAAVSRCLAKLRSHFEDPLFVRTAHGMEATPRALSLAAGAQEILNVYLDHMSEKRVFDPKRSGRTFRIAASEVGSVLVLRSMSNLIARSSPGLRLTIVPLNFHALVHGLQSGDIDLALGGFPELHSSIRQQTLFQESYCCLVRASHPFLVHPPTTTEFFGADHLIVTTQGSGHAHVLAENVLRKLLDPRRARLECYSFLAAALMANRSDLVVTVPSRTLEVLGGGFSLQSFVPPVELPTFQVRQYWHERFHDDAGHAWLRRSLAALLLHSPIPPVGATSAAKMARRNPAVRVRNPA